MGQAVGESERFVVPRKPTKVGPPGRSSRWIVDRATGRETATVGHPNDTRPSGSDGGVVGDRTDLRNRPAAGAVRLPGEPECSRRSARGTPTREHGAYRGR